MATLLLATAGAAIGNALLPGGLTLFGAAISGGTIGGLIGSLAGAQADAALFGQRTSVSGPRLGDLQITTSVEGATIPRVFGRTRLAGQVIWATRFKETATTDTVDAGKGSSVATTNYRYSATFAVGLCEGVITRIGRIWADGKPLAQDGLIMRVYRGDETQTPDTKIEAIEGAGNAPAFRGLAYVVFEDLALEAFGNRVPQLSFEVFRRVGTNQIEDRIKGVNLIPASGEFVYATEPVVRVIDQAVSTPENLNNAQGEPDLAVSLDQLDAELPNLELVQLVVSWFGNDLRCNLCQIRPGVESATKITSPVTWKAGGVTRDAAHLISADITGPYYGGTPSDASVIQTIVALKAKGWKVALYPFILMDVPPGNTLSDPYNPAGTQAVFPWRGRITCNPAPGQAGTPDKTATATTQIASFFGTATPAHFTLNGTDVVYSGPAEWSLRRFILHLAKLAQAAGGVDAFVISSELRGLTWVRSGTSAYPAVTQLKSLAADVKAILGGTTKVTYAADWSEYFGHQPTDGSNDVHFHLDPLWSDANIDAIGIDYYAPLSDWRDGTTHTDALAGTGSVYDLAYLKANVESGEGHAWYYASPAARDAQTRTTITDGAYSEPWVFRYKDLRNWWLNQHRDRPGGVRNASATAWVPQSKPIWLTEFGAPAVDKGANQPNVFYDPKSSESALPYYSSGRRDDLMQRRYIEALIDYWDPVNGNNPTSSVYSAAMIDLTRSSVWTWDARPYPDFPARASVWRDAANWERGHWLNGRMGLVPLAEVLKELAARAGVTALDVSKVLSFITGYVLQDLISPRAAMEPLLTLYHVDAAESGGQIRFTPRGQPSAATLLPDDLVAGAGEPRAPFALTRGQAASLPAAIKLTYLDSLADYRSGAVESRREAQAETRIAKLDTAVTLDAAEAQSIARRLLSEAWVARNAAAFALPPSALALEPGDVVTLTASGRDNVLRLTSLTFESAIAAEAEAAEASLYDLTAATTRTQTATPAPAYGPATVRFLDLPLLTGSEIAHAPHAAAFAEPWPGGVSIYRESDATYVINRTLEQAATIGVTEGALYQGPEWRWDDGNTFIVRLFGGTLQSLTAEQVLNGGNAAAIRNADGEWEVIQFKTAQALGSKRYLLSGLLRGQAGTESAMRNPVAAGAPFVLINSSLRQLDMALSERALSLTWRYGPQPVNVADPRFVNETLTLQGLGLRPLSPAHIKAARTSGTNDITITWVRRTRIGGDAWEGTEVPLSETAESYAVDIYNGLSVIRTLTATTPSTLYSAAQQVADFGSSTFSTLTVAAVQLGEIYGRGQQRKVTLNV